MPKDLAKPVIPLLVASLTLILSASCTQQKDNGESAESFSHLESVKSAMLPAASEGAHPGAALYQAKCAACHDQVFYKAPSRPMIASLGPKGILRAMNEGIMMSQAADIEAADRETIAEYLTGQRLSDIQDQPMPPACDAEHSFDSKLPPVSRGWGVDERNTRFQPAATGGLTAANVGELEVKWTFAYPNAFQGRSQPVYGGGAIYVGSQDGTVWALDAKTGCLRWSFQASAEVRTGIAITPWNAGDTKVESTLFFGDMLASVYALDAKSGTLRWRIKADEHRDATLTGTPTYFDNRLFVSVSSLEVVSAINPQYECCTFQGAVMALDLATGAVIWKSRTSDTPAVAAGKTSVGTTIMAPSGAPIWSAPTIDVKRNRLYVGTGENYSSPADGNSDAIIAYDLDSGRKLWVSQQTSGDAWNASCFVGIPGINNANCPDENGPDYDFGANPILIKRGDSKDIVVAGQKSGDVVGIDPDSGETLWKTPIGRGGIQGGVHFGIAAQDNVIYVPINDQIVAADDTRYNSNRAAEPGVHALNAVDGSRLWSAPSPDVCGDTQYCSPGISQAIAAIPGAVVAGYLDGRLRIHAREDGRVLWERYMLGEYQTVSGATATGGAFSGGGILVAHGLMYVNAGYGFNSHIPGNALVVLGLKEGSE
ncbi:MAG: polyvinyl alcohol dehydrogenase (cytochrome) [Halieaceae bacterium]|jgi:polyvinyl alcohol dehydrogenase (cytochrome)